MAKKSMRDRMLAASKSPYAGFFDDGDFGKIRDYIDMGAIILNCVVSGDPFKGFPSGRVVQFAGPESVGKTYVCMEAVKNAQKMGYFVVYYDSEAANDSESVLKRGIDPGMFMYVPVPTVEDLVTSMINILDEADPDDKLMIVIDSVGNLSTKKELKDSGDGSETRDMTRAQKLKALFRTCTVKAGVKNVPIGAVNHVYANIGGGLFGPSTVVAGGSGPAYANSCTLELTKAQLKRGDDVVGGIFTARATKNRLAREKTKVKFNIDHGSGISRYSGLYMIAVDLGWLILPDRARSYRLNPGGVVPKECQGQSKEAKDHYKKWLDELPTVPKDIIEEGKNEEFWMDFLTEKKFADVLRNIFAYGEATTELDFSGENEDNE
jgi:RecA/RadA recombinase